MKPDDQTFTALWCPTCGAILECEYLGIMGKTATTCNTCKARRTYDVLENNKIVSTGEEPIK